MSLFGNIVKSVAVNATIEVVDNVMKNQQAKTYIYTIEDSYYYSQKIQKSQLLKRTVFNFF